MDDIYALRYNRTTVNTGTNGGVLRLIELKLNKPIHWFICQLHANELSLCHLIQTLDGKAAGPKGYTDNISKNLHGCEKLDIILAWFEVNRLRTNNN